MVRLSGSELNEVDQAAVTAADSGTTPETVIISQHGDAVLEFDEGDATSIYRFRVLSSMLSETSPWFAQLFRGESKRDADGHGAAKRNSQNSALWSSTTLPQRLLSPTISWEDGTQVQIFRIPWSEPNKLRALEIVLHAAHHHTDKIPRSIEFDQFVAVAEICGRYDCTSPLELVVEHRWLPQWMHKAAADSVPGGMLVISYAFGLRRLFTSVSKAAILNIESEEQGKDWPPAVKGMVWKIKQAKMDQVYACCASMIQEFLSPTGSGEVHRNSRGQSIVESSVGSIMTKTRCPKGSQACDATSLGWLMMNLNHLQVLPYAMPSMGSQSPPPMHRSLSQLIDSLRCVTTIPPASASSSATVSWYNDEQAPQQSGNGGWGTMVSGYSQGTAGAQQHISHQHVSPTFGQHHGGVCDFASAFRSTIYDVYNSVTGLTLYDVTGKHGWGLSRHKVGQPQRVQRLREPVLSTAETISAPSAGHKEAESDTPVMHEPAEMDGRDYVAQTASIATASTSPGASTPRSSSLMPEAASAATDKELTKREKLEALRELREIPSVVYSSSGEIGHDISEGTGIAGSSNEERDVKYRMPTERDSVEKALGVYENKQLRDTYNRLVGVPSTRA